MLLEPTLLMRQQAASPLTAPHHPKIVLLLGYQLTPQVLNYCRRFYLEIEGKRRFKVAESWEQDGYRVARPEFFQDALPAEGTPEHTAQQTVCRTVDDMVTVWLDKVRWAHSNILLHLWEKVLERAHYNMCAHVSTSI